MESESTQLLDKKREDKINILVSGAIL